MARSWTRPQWWTSRVFAVWLALVSSSLLVAAPSGPAGASPPVGPVGPITLITSTRVLDTRASQPPGIATTGFDAATGTAITAGPIPGGTTRRYRIAGQTFPQGGGTFAFPATIYGVLINVTEVGPAGGGFLTVFPGNVSDANRPLASTLNPIDPINFNFAVVETDPNPASGAGYGSIAIFTTLTVDVLVDVYGYFTAPLPPGTSGVSAVTASAPLTSTGGATPNLSLAPNSVWSTTGNAGTNPSTNFLGTTDTQPLVVRTNNAERLRVDPTGTLFVGATTDVLPNSGGGRVQVSASGTTPGLVARSESGPGIVSVGGFAGLTGLTGNPAGAGVKGDAGAGFGVLGQGTARGVAGVVGNATAAGEGSYGVGGFTGTTGAIGVLGNSSTSGVYGTLGNAPCPPGAAVAGCAGSAVAAGVAAQSDATTAVYAFTNTGNLFVGLSPGETTRRVRIDATGKGFFNGGTQSSGADYADSLPTSDPPSALEPGDVLAIDPEAAYAVRQSREANSPLVAGVYSTRPALLGTGERGIDDSLAGEVPVALVGVVPTKVSAENGPIQPGDLLTTAATPGHAMKALRPYEPGTLLGKALEPLPEGIGVIRVLVSLR